MPRKPYGTLEFISFQWILCPGRSCINQFLAGSHVWDRHSWFWRAHAPAFLRLFASANPPPLWTTTHVVPLDLALWPCHDARIPWALVGQALAPLLAPLGPCETGPCGPPGDIHRRCITGGTSPARPNALSTVHLLGEVCSLLSAFQQDCRHPTESIIGGDLPECTF